MIHNNKCVAVLVRIFQDNTELKGLVIFNKKYKFFKLTEKYQRIRLGN